MIIKAWVLEEGRRQEKRKGEREALREHFSYDGLHTPISPMKSFPPWKELKEGCVGQCVSKTSQDHPKNSMPCHRGRAAVTHVEALTRPPHKEQTPLGLSSGLMQWKHSHKDTWFLLKLNFFLQYKLQERWAYNKNPTVFSKLTNCTNRVRFECAQQNLKQISWGSLVTHKSRAIFSPEVSCLRPAHFSLQPFILQIY